MRERIAYLDFLRCLAIFLVILLHTLVPVVTNTGVYGVPSWKLCVALDAFTRVGVPLFFMPDALAGGDAAVCSVLPQKPAQDWHSPGSVEPHLLRGESPDVW